MSTHKTRHMQPPQCQGESMATREGDGSGKNCACFGLSLLYKLKTKQVVLYNFSNLIQTYS